MNRPQSPTTERLSAITTDIEAVVRRHDPDWTSSNSGDPGVTLVELLGWIADSLSAYQDQSARGSALGTARGRFQGLASRPDPYKNFKFRVKWDGAYIPGISRVSGLGRIVQEVEYRDGASPNIVRRIPGSITYEPITLERGITDDTAFEDWANQVRQLSAGAGSGAVPASYLKNVRIEVLNDAGQPVIAYDVYRCWPSVYRPLPELEAGLPLRLVEAITLVHDGWERDLTVVYPA
jgi:phage tail-like protein